MACAQRVQGACPSFAGPATRPLGLVSAIPGPSARSFAGSRRLPNRVMLANGVRNFCGHHSFSSGKWKNAGQSATSIYGATVGAEWVSTWGSLRRSRHLPARSPWGPEVRGQCLCQRDVERRVRVLTCMPCSLGPRTAPQSTGEGVQGEGIATGLQQS